MGSYRRAWRKAEGIGFLVAIGATAIACRGTTELEEGGGSQPGPTPIPIQPQAAGRDVLAVSFGGEVRLVSMNGTHHSVLAGDPFFAGMTGVDLVGIGGYLVARVYAEGAPSSGLRLALIRSDGSVQWTRTFAVSFAGGATDTPLHWGMSVGEDGAVVMDDRSTDKFHIASIGSPGDLPGFFPAGASIDGFLPVRSAWTAGNPDDTTFGWWKVGTDPTLANVTHVVTNVGDWTSFAGRLLKIDASNTLLLQTASSTESIALPGATSDAHVGALAREMLTADERWLLVTSGVAGRVIRVDLRAKSAAQIDLLSPDGFRPFANCETTTPIEGGLQIDRDGRIVRLFRDDDRVAPFATEDGTHWSQVGGSFTDIGGIGLDVERGTLSVNGHSAVDCYVPGPKWATTANADFSGDWAEIVRTQSGARIAAPGATALGYVTSRSGQLGARWEVDGTTHPASLHVVDFETGVDTIVATAEGSVRSAEPVWLWQP